MCSSPALAEPPAVSAIAVDGTEFVVTLTSGKILRSGDLTKTVLDVRFEGRPTRLRIAAVERDPQDKSGTVWLHAMEERQADGTWRNICTPGADGRRQGFPMVVQGRLEFTCSSGALGKCVRLGYRPWAFDLHGQSLAPLHAACVRMMRGDYGGTGEPWTSEGKLVEVFDLQGIQRPAESPSLAFEAGWTPQGAVCVHHTRVKQNITLAALQRIYPWLEGKTGAVCSEVYARRLGAIIFNHSTP